MVSPIRAGISNIHGRGMFAARNIPIGEVIQGYTSDTGFNHSCKPNLRIAFLPHQIQKVEAIRDIGVDEELTVFYLHKNDVEWRCNCPTCKCFILPQSSDITHIITIPENSPTIALETILNDEEDMSRETELPPRKSSYGSIIRNIVRSRITRR